jgi:predicted glycosyltransferase
LSKLRVFIYVQHLLGIGHLKRAAVLAQACAAQGMETTLASGGMPVRAMVPGSVRLVQLPPARAADVSFKALLDEQGRVIDDAWKHARAAALLEAWRLAQADVLVLELYPFGRRQMRFELLPLLEAAAAAQPRPAIVCSVRDVLGGLKGAERQQEAISLIEQYFDRVLVHGDAKAISFERSLANAYLIAGRIAYTGYIVDEAPPAGEAGRNEVLVSAGGGAVGAPLIEAALGAKPLSVMRAHRWRVLAGDNLPDADFRALGARAAQDAAVVFERSRPDFTAMLANCALSISQAGYNTLLETLRARARAVVVPFAAGNETEQTLRARSFAARGAVEVVEEASLTPASLATAIDRAVRRPAPGAGAIDLDGARKSAALIEQLARDRRA